MDIVIHLILFFASGVFGYWIAMREGRRQRKRTVREGKLEQ
jgi:hypothetical protein